jgi:catechol 2,3-dioxygenase-like lactoylglutathione lyase family enzyme
MRILAITPQLRTTNLERSIDFYTKKLGFTIDFRYEDFYAGLRVGDEVVHLKLADEPDPSIEFVGQGEHFHLYVQTDDAVAAAEELKRNGVEFVKDVHKTDWGTVEFIVRDDQGHTLYFGERAENTGA